MFGNRVLLVFAVAERNVHAHLRRFRGDEFGVEGRAGEIHVTSVGLLDLNGRYAFEHLRFHTATVDELDERHGGRELKADFLALIHHDRIDLSFDDHRTIGTFVDVDGLSHRCFSDANVGIVRLVFDDPLVAFESQFRWCAFHGCTTRLNKGKNVLRVD